MKDKIFASDEQNERYDQNKQIQNKLPAEHFTNIKHRALFFKLLHISNISENKIKIQIGGIKH